MSGPTTLLGFLQHLRLECHFRLGLDQYLAASRLVERLVEEGRAPERPEEWAEWLAPLLCKNPEQQRMLAGLWGEWLARSAGMVGGEEGERSEAGEKGEKGGVAEVKAVKLRRSRWVLLLLSLLLVLLNVPSEVPKEVPTEVQPLTQPEVASDALDETTPARPLRPTIQSFYEAIPPSSRQVSLNWALRLTGPLSALGFWLWWVRRRKKQPAAFLERRASSGLSEREKLQIPLGESLPGLRKGLRGLVKRLNRRSWVESQEWDPVATLLASLRRGGLLTPVRQKRRRAPHYLILVERKNRRDQQSRRLESWLGQLKRAGVELELYFFQGDPRLCQAAKSGEALPLELLSERFQQSSLLIFSEAEGFYHAYRDEPQEWLSQFNAWPKKTLLTHTPPGEWGTLQRRLQAHGFVVLPATVEALQALQERAGDGWQRQGGDDEPRLPRPLQRLLHDLENNADLEPDERRRLLLELGFWLDETGFQWLCACAVFPELHWELVHYLGRKLFEQEEQDFENRLRHLQRLPWLRLGHMPDWLRHLLIERLSPGREQEIRDLLYALCERVPSAGELPGGLALEIAKKPRRGIKHKSEGLLRDPFFLEVVGGRRPSRLALAIPPSLRLWLLRDGNPQLGLRPFPLLLALLVLGGLGAWLVRDLGLAVSQCELRIQSNISGTVTLNGVDEEIVGEKDMIVREGLAPGKYELRFEGEGVELIEGEIELRAGQRLRVGLDPIPVPKEEETKQIALDSVPVPKEKETKQIALDSVPVLVEEETEQVALNPVQKEEETQQVALNPVPKEEETKQVALDRVPRLEEINSKPMVDTQILFPIGTKPGERFVTQLAGVEVAFRWIPPGTFVMGSPGSEKGRLSTEGVHEVTLGRGFWLGETETTQGLWQGVMGDNPGYFDKGGNYPVEEVSWEDCQVFFQELGKKTGLSLRLPTEAEWEYACRAGTRTPFHYGSRLDATMANFNGNYPYGGAPVGEDRGQTTVVRTFAPNAWGLYDMHGNVWEWCSDWYGVYPEKSIENPIGPVHGTERVLRGGSWSNYGRNCRSAYRFRSAPGYRFRYFGFRLAASSSGK